MPIISIVIPVYNVEPYIAECLESVRAQIFTEFEVILIDDGSTDASGHICDWYTKKDERFHVIHKENGGVSSARNVGLEKAKGKFLAFIDPDDYISENFYASMYTNIKKYDADFAGCKTYEVTEAGGDYLTKELRKLLGGGDAPETVLYDGANAVLQATLENQFSCVAWNKLFSRELWGKERFPENLSLGEDMAITLDIITNAKCAVYVPDALYYWRQRGKSLLHGTVNYDRFLEDLAGSQMMKEKLLKKYPDMEKAIGRLKLHYDLGCAVNYLASNKSDGGNGSLLYKILRGAI